MVKISPDATQNCSRFSLRYSAFTVEKESDGEAAHTQKNKILKNSLVALNKGPRAQMRIITKTRLKNNSCVLFTMIFICDFGLNVSSRIGENLWN